jgi:hypothetical protein
MDIEIFLSIFRAQGTHNNCIVCFKNLSFIKTGLYVYILKDINQSNWVCSNELCITMGIFMLLNGDIDETACYPE